MFDLFPDSPAVIADFFITDQQHYEALYYPIRAGDITVKDLDRVLGDPEAITKLVNAAPSNPHHGIVFGFGEAGMGGGMEDPEKQLWHILVWPTHPDGPSEIQETMLMTNQQMTDLADALRDLMRNKKKIQNFDIRRVNLPSIEAFERKLLSRIR